MLDAFKKAGLGDQKKIQREEEKKSAASRAAEARSRPSAIQALVDEEGAIAQERYFAAAAREGRKAASRVGTKQYFDRFKK